MPLVGEKAIGFIQYVNLPAIATVPEPSALSLSAAASHGLLLIKARAGGKR